MANWSLPTLTSTYTNFVSEVSTRLNDAVQQFSLASNASTATSVPTNAMAFDTTNLNWSKFNGTSWITIGTTYNINAATATAWQTARAISITGDLTWTVTTNGTAAVTAAATLATVNGTVGTFGSATAVPIIAVNGKGLITGMGTAALGTIATQAASAVSLTGGSITGLTTLGLPLGTGSVTEGLAQWDNTNDLLRIGTGTVTKVMVDLDSTQTLTNKTLTNPVINQVTSNTYTESLGLGGLGQFQAPYGAASSWYNVGIRNDGSTVYFLQSAVQTTLALARTASWNTFRPFAWTLATGAVSIDATGAGCSFGATPTCPTQAVTISSTQIATTAFATPRTSVTGSSKIPTGTTAQRDASPAQGYLRFNSTIVKPEVWNGTAWGSVGGGATGAGTDEIFYENSQVVTTSYTLTTGKNAMTAGPITINSGITVTVPTGASWSIV